MSTVVLKALVAPLCDSLSIVAVADIKEDAQAMEARTGIEPMYTVLQTAA